MNRFVRLLEGLDAPPVARVDGHDFFLEALLRFVVCAARAGIFGGGGGFVGCDDPWCDFGGGRVAEGVGIEGGEEGVVEVEDRDGADCEGGGCGDYWGEGEERLEHPAELCLVEAACT